MKLKNILLFVSILLAFVQLSFGQNIDDDQPNKNWLKDYISFNDTRLFHNYSNYSQEDLVKFREKFDLLKVINSDNEWEGVYYSGSGGETGFSQMRFSSKSGFLDFYVDTCLPELNHINYGTVIISPDSVQFLPELVGNSPRKAVAVKYVKIKWADRYYLVEESSLAAFAEQAVGIYIEPDEVFDEDIQKWANFWFKGDYEKLLTGLPEFPASYKKFQRSPIEATILSVGKRKIDKEISTGNRFYTADSAVYTVKLSAGKNNGIKEGMKFFTLGKEEIFITKVNQNTSTGILVRAINEEKNAEDHCLTDDAQKIICPEIQPSEIVKTRVGYFWF